ncbi:MAG TPA: GMP synthase (glutamine-hydrolyzing), partial [Planctomycetes bacterium]|nr:GMP synthase (glutamine-hydrolyzing) [Planctomycetota bacterium]
MHERVLIIDFGSQYTQLIARRVRENRVYSEVVPPAKALEASAKPGLKGIVLSGGPASAYADGAPDLPVEILDAGVPVLGICYGLQWLCETLGGRVVPGETREFGFTELQVDDDQSLLAGVSKETVVWMSHGDRVEVLPEGFVRLAGTDHCPEAAVGDAARGLFGLQFHPEVAHTREGDVVLKNFLDVICACSGDWTPGDLAEEMISSVAMQLGDTGEMILGLSGGVDSSV